MTLYLSGGGDEALSQKIAWLFFYAEEAGGALFSFSFKKIHSVKLNELVFVPPFGDQKTAI